MPIFSYKCMKCKKEFEEITGVINNESGIKCPVCESKNLKKLISNFSVGKAPAPSCAGPGCPSNCPSNKIG
ncbi:MAG: FmdB family zinc ribbon protein [Elusimicrobiota bacterium]